MRTGYGRAVGAIEDFPGWRFDPLPGFNRNNLLPVDDLIPDVPWFWGGIEGACVVDCCGISAFDFRAAYVAWAMGASDEEPDPVRGSAHYRQPKAHDLEPLVDELRAAASLLAEIDDPVVQTNRLGAFIAPGELAALLDHLASALTRSG